MLELISIRWIPVQCGGKNLGECDEGFGHGGARVDLSCNAAFSQLRHGKSEIQGVLALKRRIHKAFKFVSHMVSFQHPTYGHR